MQIYENEARVGRATTSPPALACFYVYLASTLALAMFLVFALAGAFVRARDRALKHDLALASVCAPLSRH